MFLKNFFEEFWLKLKNEGCIGTLNTLLWRLSFSTIYFQKFTIYQRSLAQVLPLSVKKTQFEVRRITVDDIHCFHNLAGPLKQAQFLRRLKAKDSCLGVFDKKKMIYYTWIGNNWVKLDNIKLVRLKKEESSFFNSYALPEYRNRGLHAALCVERLRAAKEQGYQRAVAIASLNNLYAQRALEKVGFEKRGTLALLKVFWMKKTRILN